MSERESIQESIECIQNDRRQQLSVSSVRRKLFGDCNANEKAAIQDNLKNMLNECRQQARERWNFDFENEQPLEGNWKWEKVSNTTCISNIGSASTISMADIEDDSLLSSTSDNSDTTKSTVQCHHDNCTVMDNPSMDQHQQTHNESDTGESNDELSTKYGIEKSFT